MNLQRFGVALAAVATMSLTLAACGDDPADEPNDDTMASSSPADQTFGAGCSAIPEDGAGSFDGMSTEPVATAASANPLLTTLVAAVTQAELVETLNTADGITVFAPTDDAFAKIPEADLNAVLADKALLTKILTHHVIGAQLGPDEVAGTHDTLNKDKLTVSGSDEEFTVGKENAAVLCGNIPTSNATVYVIDTVLMP